MTKRERWHWIKYRLFCGWTMLGMVFGLTKCRLCHRRLWLVPSWTFLFNEGTCVITCEPCGAALKATQVYRKLQRALSEIAQSN